MRVILLALLPLTLHAQNNAVPPPDTERNLPQLKMPTPPCPN